MKLPAADQAVVDRAKVHDYLLSTGHSIGRFKAAFFMRLGYEVARWRRLEADLRGVAVTGDARLGRWNPYGQKYEVRGVLTGPSGRKAQVVTVWIILKAQDVPRFVTAYPGGRA